MKPRRAMVMAAGHGARMRPLTVFLPKPLIPVRGRTMLDRALDALDAAGVDLAAVNSHWLAGALHAHLAGRARPRILISHEPELLDTGGGLAQVRAALGEAPLYLVNGDTLWTEGSVKALDRLASSWDDARMDALLLLAEPARARGHDGAGDFDMGADGRLSRRRGPAAPVFMGVQIFRPSLLDGFGPGAFSLNLAFDRAIASGRLHGLMHEGLWFHVGTPAALALAEAEWPGR